MQHLQESNAVDRAGRPRDPDDHAHRSCLPWVPGAREARHRRHPLFHLYRTRSYPATIATSMAAFGSTAAESAQFTAQQSVRGILATGRILRDGAPPVHAPGFAVGKWSTTWRRRTVKGLESGDSEFVYPI